MAEMLAVNHMKMCGQITQDTAVITGATWSETGAVLDVPLTSGNRLTTYRNEDGTLPALPAQTWRHDVAGFEIERAGVFMQPDSVTLTDDGTTNGTAQISISYAAQNDDVLHYMRGGGYGHLRLSDMIEGYSYNIPATTLSGQAAPLAPLKNLPQGAFLTASGLSSENQTAGFATSATGPYFLDPLDIGAGHTALTFALKGTLSATGSTGALLGLSGAQITFETMANSSVRLTVKSSAGTLLSAVSSNSGLIPFGTSVEIRLAIDLTAGWVRLFIDDVEQLDSGNPMWTFAPSSGELASSRSLSALAKNNGASQSQGSIERIAIWLAAETDGSEPTSTPYKEITGDAAAINTDSWKLGDDAT